MDDTVFVGGRSIAVVTVGWNPRCPDRGSNDVACDGLRNLAKFGWFGDVSICR